MITDFDKILNDLSSKVSDGIPDLKNIEPDTMGKIVETFWSDK